MTRRRPPWLRRQGSLPFERRCTSKAGRRKSPTSTYQYRRRHPERDGDSCSLVSRVQRCSRSFPLGGGESALGTLSTEALAREGQNFGCYPRLYHCCEGTDHQGP